MRLPAAFALALAFSACAGGAKSTLHRDPAYDAKSLAGRIMVLFPVQVKSVPADFRDVFPPDSADRGDASLRLQRLFAAWGDSLVDNVTFVVDSAARGDTVPTIDYSGTLDNREKTEGFQIRFPGTIRFSNSTWPPDVGLQISELAFQEGKGVGASSGGLGGAGAQSPGVLKMQGAYLIWDYRKNKPIVYGRLNGDFSYPFEMSRGVWQYAIALTVANIVRGSPLAGKKLETWMKNQSDDFMSPFPMNPFPVKVPSPHR